MNLKLSEHVIKVDGGHLKGMTAPIVYLGTHGYNFLRTNHIKKLELALNKLKESGLKCNIEKYFFGQTKMEYLRFWVTRDGVKQ